MHANDEQPVPSKPLPEGRFDGREAFAQLVRDALACAAREGWRELILSDAHFGDWPLGERSVVASLGAWAHTGRKLVMLAKNYDEVTRSHARFVAWRKTWGHIMDCRRLASADALDIPSAIWSPQWTMHRIDPQLDRGVCGSNAAARVTLRESLDECLRASSPGFPASVLGL